LPDDQLAPGSTFNLPVVLRGDALGRQSLAMLFAFTAVVRLAGLA
jgi:hypothetical protein